MKNLLMIFVLAIISAPLFAHEVECHEYDATENANIQETKSNNIFNISEEEYISRYESP